MPEALATEAPAPAAAVVEAPAAAPPAVTPAPAAVEAPATPAVAAPPTNPQAPAAPAAPETYEFKAPEGVELHENITKAFEGVARELGLPQDKAQSVIDKVAPVIAKQTEARFQAQLAGAKAKWTADAKVDPDLAAGQGFEANLAVAQKTFETFGSPELKQLLNSSGLGNHPTMLKWAFKVGQRLMPDTSHPSGGNPSGLTGREAAARALYPNQK